MENRAIIKNNEYKEFFTLIKTEIQNAQIKASIAVVFVKRKVYQFSIEKYTIILKKINGFLAIPQFL